MGEPVVLTLGSALYSTPLGAGYRRMVGDARLDVWIFTLFILRDSGWNMDFLTNSSRGILGSKPFPRQRCKFDAPPLTHIPIGMAHRFSVEDMLMLIV